MINFLRNLPSKFQLLPHLDSTTLEYKGHILKALWAHNDIFYYEFTTRTNPMIGPIYFISSWLYYVNFIFTNLFGVFIFFLRCL